MAAIVPLRAPRGPELALPVSTPGSTPLPANTGAGIVPTIRLVVPEDDGPIEIRIGSEADDKPRRIKRRSNSTDFGRNLALDMDDYALAALASYIIESVDADDQDRLEWTETVDQVAAFLGIKLESPQSSTAEDGTVCKAVATCMLEAAMKLWGTAYAEMLPAGGPVKVQREETPKPAGAVPGDPANDDQGQDDMAQALEKDLNWYLTVGDRGFYSDTSKMLFHRTLVGIQFKELFNCPIANKPISRWVRSQDFIMHGDPAHLSESTRHTVRKKVSQSLMRRMMAKDYYRDIPLVAPTGDTSRTEISTADTQGISPTPSLPRDYEHTIYQCHCELGSGTSHDLFGDLEMLDLDETGADPGYPLPYRVEVDKDSRAVLGIFRDWKRGDKDHKRRPRFVPYPFIPGFGFYGLGLIHLVGNPTQAATMLERSSVDAGLFANFPGWLMKQGPASKMESTIFRLNPGEVAKIATGGSDKLSDVIMPVPYKPPSDQALAMAAALESKVQRLAGIVEIPVGEGRIGNTPVGTIMAYIESIAMVPGAVHKQDHIAQAEEFALLRELIAEDPKVLWRGNPSPARKWQAKEELLNQNLSPRSDPNTPSQIHRLTKLQALVTAAGLPQFQGIADQRGVWMRLIGTVASDKDGLTLPQQAAPPMPPDPKIQAAQIKAGSDQAVAQVKAQEAHEMAQAKLAQVQIQSQDRDQDREAANQRELLKHSQAQAKTGADLAAAGASHVHDAQQGAADRLHDAAAQSADRAHDAATQSADHAQENFSAAFGANQDKGSS